MDESQSPLFILKLVQGEKRKARLNRFEARVPSAALEPPDFLGETGTAKWRELAPQLLRSGLLTRLDRDMLAGYCSAFQTYASAEQTLVSTAIVIRGYRDQPVSNPYLRVRDRALETMRRYAQQIGLTPSARSRNHAAPGGGMDGDLEFFLDGDLS